MPDGMISDSGVFTSWKEIASYLGKGVRTVQRWEAQFGLPVQRPNAHAKGIVRATREELDQWIATRWSPRSEKVALADGSVEVRPPLASRSTKTGIEVMEALRMEHRALVTGLRQSLEQLALNCQDLALRVQLSRDLAALHSGSSFTETQFAPPLLPADREAKPD
jgi:hypothetical protein